MNFIDIRRDIEKRKYSLMNVLDNNKDDMEIAKQHQLFGAIKELESVLRIMDYYRKEEVKTNFEMKMSSETEKSFLKKLSMKLKK